MAECRAAFYARVSSEAQARDNTIASQVAALRERITADGAVVDPGNAYIDDGHSGSSLVRPALERLREPPLPGTSTASTCSRRTGLPGATRTKPC